MKIFNETTELSPANLNSVFQWDAKVDGSIAASSGNTYKTITEALDAHHKSIFVVPGTYTENVTINDDGVYLYSPSTSFFDSSDGSNNGGAIIDPTSSSTPGIIVNGNYCTVYGIEVTTCSDHHISVYGDNNLIINCSTTNGLVVVGTNNIGIFVNGNKCKVLNCVARDNGGTNGRGIYVTNTNDIIINNCLITDSSSNGIRIYNTTNCIVTNNIIIGNDSIPAIGLSIEDSTAMVSGNILLGASSSNFLVIDSTTVPPVISTLNLTT